MLRTCLLPLGAELVVRLLFYSLYPKVVLLVLGEVTVKLVLEEVDGLSPSFVQEDDIVLVHDTLLNTSVCMSARTHYGGHVVDGVCEQFNVMLRTPDTAHYTWAVVMRPA